MAGKRVIDDDKLIGMLERDFKPAEIARSMGVSRSAVTQRIKRLKVDAAKPKPGKEGKRFIAAKLNALEQMSRVNASTLWIVEQLQNAIQGKPTDLKKLKKEMVLKWIETGADKKKKSRTLKKMEKFDFMTDPIKLLLMGNAEVANQWRTWLELLKYTNPIKETMTAFEVIFDWLEKKYDPDVRKQIVFELGERLGREPLLIQLRRETEAREPGEPGSHGDQRVPGGEPPGTEEGD